MGKTFKKLFRSLVTSEIPFLIPIVLVTLYFLWRSFRYQIPLGDDGIIYYWPAGKALAEAGSLGTALKILVSSFISEDHLSPICYLSGYFLYKIGSNPELTFSIATKVSYVLIFLSACYLFNELYQDRKKTLLFALLFALNMTLTWKNMVSPLGLNISVLFCLWSIYFVHRYLESDQTKDLVICLIAFFLTTFSFETSFIVMPLIAIHTIFFYMARSNKDYKLALIKIMKFGSLLLLCFVPYMIIHYKIYGLIIPSSRISEPLTWARIYAFYASLFLDWNFGFSKVFQFFFLATSVALVFRKKYFNFNSVGLIVSLILILFLIGSTGRRDDGIWTFAGIIYLFIFTDFIYSLAENKIAFPLVFIACLIMLFPRRLQYEYFANAEPVFYQHVRDLNTAYRAINSPTKDITMIRLPGAKEISPPFDFWIGNQIFNKKGGLEFIEEHYMLIFRNMNVRSFDNSGNLSFYELSDLIDYFVKVEKEKTAVLIKDHNSYTRFFDPKENNNLESRSEILPDAPQDTFSLKLLPESSNKRLKTLVKVNFRKCENLDLGKIVLLLNDQAISDVSTKDCGLSFDSTKLDAGKENRLRLENTKASVQSILVYREGVTQNSQQIPLIKLNIKSKRISCRYTISYGGMQLAGTIDSGAERNLHIPFVSSGEMFVYGKDFGANRFTVLAQAHNLKIKDKSPITAEVCW